MAYDRPAESISGPNEWRWNRLHGDEETEECRTKRSRHRPTANQHAEDQGSDRQGDIARKITALEAEIQRKDRRLQHVIEQYERRLSEKNRQLARDRDGGEREGESAQSMLLGTLRRYLTDG
jgi:hypothetical protein